jgi:hypothetical protein
MAIRINQRMFKVQDAKQRIQSQISDMENENDLTFGEIVSILSEILLSYSKYAIREERHGDDSKPGDRA